MTLTLALALALTLTLILTLTLPLPLPLPLAIALTLTLTRYDRGQELPRYPSNAAQSASAGAADAHASMQAIDDIEDVIEED